MSVLAVIPARYGSTRFPGKPLALLADGRPMIVHTWERVCQTPGVDEVIVATDDTRIQAVVVAAGGNAVLTSSHHPSGTDRCWEVAQPLTQFECVVNVQGDEPCIDAGSIQAALDVLHQQPSIDIATLITPMAEGDGAITDPNAVKVVISPLSSNLSHVKALYFSRSPIPYHRTTEAAMPYYRHVGLYAYRRKALEAFVSWPPSPLEQTEQLEQLRALENGLIIGAAVVAQAPKGVDTPEDLALLLAALLATSA
ncbi:MAG: 3-deoxy-manno-octulosonate cytidylyltransferase [Vampirovibrionales bacterium]|nr:3-deoxy-manno-octulosonate cytidylyltransferase [Vampirovibrionales bacterium]